MNTTQLIHLDYQRAVIEAIKRSLTMTHGDVFAAHFICEHEQAVLSSAKKRIYGNSEDWLIAETLRLKAEHRESKVESVNDKHTSRGSTILTKIAAFF